MWMRDVNDHRSTWNTDLTLASSPPSYDPRTQTIRGWLNRSIPAAYQLAFTVEGGPVGVEQDGGVTRAARVVRVWPMPAAERLKIESDRPIEHIQIFNVHGQALEVSTYINDHNATVNLSPLPTGTYVVVVDGDRRLVPLVR